MGWDGLNRRQFPRIMYPCLVKILDPNAGSQGQFLTHTENVGTGGLCIILKKEIKMFSAVKIELDLIEEEKNLSLSGRVAWSVRRKAIDPVKPLFYDIGIEFDPLDEKDKKKLEDAVNNFIKKGYKIVKPVY